MNEDTCYNLGKCEFICIHDNIGLIIDCSPGIPRQWGRNRHKPCDRGGHWEDISLIRKPSTEGILHDIIIWCITSLLLAVFLNVFLFWDFFMANTWFFFNHQKIEVCNYNSSQCSLKNAISTLQSLLLFQQLRDSPEYKGYF